MRYDPKINRPSFFAWGVFSDFVKKVHFLHIFFLHMSRATRVFPIFTHLNIQRISQKKWKKIGWKFGAHQTFYCLLLPWAHRYTHTFWCITFFSKSEIFYIGYLRGYFMTRTDFFQFFLYILCKQSLQKCVQNVPSPLYSPLGVQGVKNYSDGFFT